MRAERPNRSAATQRLAIVETCLPSIGLQEDRKEVVLIQPKYQVHCRGCQVEARAIA